MAPTNDEQQIRDVVATWMRATREDDVESVLALMAEDVVFLRPGSPPLRGRDTFAAASRSAVGKVKIDGKSEIQEILIAGDYAFCWNRLTVTITSTQGGEAKTRAGDVLSVFRRESEGRWVLARDANMISPV